MGKNVEKVYIRACVHHVNTYGVHEENVENRLCEEVNSRNEGFSSEKLEHIPQVSENYCKGCLNKFRGVAVEHSPHTPDKQR